MSQMVIIPNFVAVEDGLITVGQITWTTGLNNFADSTMEEAQIRSTLITSSSTSAPSTPATSPTTSTTRRLFPAIKADRAATPICSGY